MRQAKATMHRIGLELIEERRAQLTASAVDAQEHDTDGRDLLSVLRKRIYILNVVCLLTMIIVRSDMASDPSQRLSLTEILCQISTFIAAGTLAYTMMYTSHSDILILQATRQHHPL